LKPARGESFGMAMTVNLDMTRFSLAPSPFKVDSVRPVYHVFITENENGAITAQCAEIPAAITQGSDREQALLQIFDAIQTVLEASSSNDTEFVVLPTYA